MGSPDAGRPAVRPLLGGCYCGAVRFEIAAVFDARYCHCSECRRSSGAPVTATAVVRREDFRVTAGAVATALRPNGTDHLCAACRQSVYYEFETPVGTMESVSIGLLDDAEACPPRFHQFYDRRLRWLHVHDTLPKYAGNRVPHPRDRR
jgi:hypothetical protein